jgi:hypothetical protein
MTVTTTTKEITTMNTRTDTNIVIDSVERALGFASTVAEYRYCRNKAIYQTEQADALHPKKYPANLQHHRTWAAEWLAKAAKHALILDAEYNMPSYIIDCHDEVPMTIFGGAA